VVDKNLAESHRRDQGRVRFLSRGPAHRPLPGAQILARSEGTPRKCLLRLTPATSLHLFEVGPERARRADDKAFDPGSINHFAIEARDPGEFVRIRASLIQAGRTDETVYDAPDLYTIFATDPDGLFIELTLRKVAGWDPPFATEPFRGLGQPAVPNAVQG
jgi:hypothetical protein